MPVEQKWLKQINLSKFNKQLRQPLKRSYAVPNILETVQ